MSDDYDTLLHLVAKFPSIEIINNLSGSDLGNVDIDAKDRDHLMARELLHAHNSDPDTSLAFQRLMTRITNQQKANTGQILDTQSTVWDSSPDNEIFVDAVEY